MAIIDPNQQSASGQVGQPVVLGTGQTLNYGDTSTPSNTAGSPTQPKVSSGFTNISKYLQANQPTQFGQQVAGKVTGLGSQATQSLQQQQQQFGQQLGQAQQALSGSVAQGTQLIGQASDIGFGTTDYGNQIGQFQQFLGGSYQGPQGLQNATQALAQARLAQQAGQYATQAGVGGKAQLLQSFYGTPTYSQGQQGLDALLLTQGGAAQALRQAGQATRGLETSTQQGINVAAQQAQAQQRADLAARQQMKGSLESTYQTGLTEAQQEQQQAEQKAQQGLSDLQSRIASGQLTAGDVSALGLKTGQMYRFGGANIGGALGLNAADLSDIAKTTSQQTTARMLGLAKLAGTIDPTVQAGQFDLSKAGTYQGVKVGDISGALQGVQAAYTAGQAQQAQIKSQIQKNSDTAAALNQQFSSLYSTITKGGGKATPSQQAQLSSLSTQIQQLNQANAGLTQQYGNIGTASYV